MDRQLAKKTDSILFVKIENDGFGLGAQRREQTGSDLPDAVNVIKDYVTAIRNGKPESFITEEKPCGALLVKKVKLAENGEYNLTGDRYKTVEIRKHQKWPMIELGEICDLYQPKTITSKDLVEDGKYKVFGANGIIGFYNEYNHEDSEVLVTCRGATCGTINRSEPKSWVTGNAMVVKPYDDTVVSKDFLFYLLKNVDMSQVISGAAQPQITRQALYPFKIPLPPLEVQREIVAEIEGYQKLIDGCRQVVDSWKPQIEINPEWPMVKLGDVCEINPQSADPSEIFGDSEFVYIDITSVENGTGKISYENRLTPNIAPSRARRLVKENDVLLSTVRPNLRAFAILKLLPPKVIASTGFAVLRSKELILPDFLYYVICSESSVNQMISNMVKGAYPSINNTDVENINITLPPLEVQQEIVAKIESERKVIDGCRELIKTYEDKIKRVIDNVWEV